MRPLRNGSGSRAPCSCKVEGNLLLRVFSMMNFVVFKGISMMNLCIFCFRVSEFVYLLFSRKVVYDLLFRVCSMMNSLFSSDLDN